MEIVELKDHPWFGGVQFHTAYLSHDLMPCKRTLASWLRLPDTWRRLRRRACCQWRPYLDSRFCGLERVPLRECWLG
jgi:hypothetical protein